VTKISVELEFLEESLNLPPQTSNAMEWSHPCPLCWVRHQGMGRDLTIPSYIIMGHATEERIERIYPDPH
jgi:hypothetical protein